MMMGGAEVGWVNISYGRKRRPGGCYGLLANRQNPIR